MCMLNRIKEFWCKNRVEIIDSVTNTEQNEQLGKKKQEEIEEKIKREYKAVIIPLIVGIVYVLVGAVLLWNLKDNLFVAEPQNIVFGFELIILSMCHLKWSVVNVPEVVFRISLMSGQMKAGKNR